MSDRTLQATITATDRASPVFKQVANGADTMGKSVDNAGKTGSASLTNLSAKAAAMGAAFASVGAVLGQWNRSAQDAAAVQRQLEASIAATGQSFAQYATQIQAAGQHAVQLGIDDEKAFQAISALTQITGSAGTALQLLGTAEDVSAAKGMDLVSAAELIGRVHEGNTGILQRYGIVVQQGATAEEALAAIQQQTAGQAEAHATTYARLREELSNVTDAIGGTVGQFAPFLQMLPGLSAGITLAGAAVGALIPELEGATVATLALDTALGPVGLVLAAGAAAAIIYKLTQSHHDEASAADQAAAATDKLVATIKQLNASGSPQGAAAQKFYTDLQGAVVDLNNEIDALKQKIATPPDTGGVPATEQYDDQLKDLEAQLRHAGRAQEDLNKILSDTGTGAAIALSKTKELFDQYEAGAITLDQLETGLGTIASMLSQYDYDANRAAKAADDLAKAQDRQADAQQKQADTIKFFADAQQEAATETQYAWDQANASIDDYAKTAQANAEAQAKNAQAIKDYAQTASRAGDVVAQSVQSQDAAAAAHERTTTAVIAEGSALAAVLGPLNTLRGSLDEAGTALQRFEAGSHRASDALGAFKEVQDGLIGQERVFGQQASEYSQQVNAMTAAHDILAQRQADGVQLTKEQTEFMDRYDEALGRAQGGVEDATVAQGLLAEQYALNMEKGDQLNKSLDGVKNVSGDLTDAIRDLIDALNGVPDEKKSKIVVEGGPEGEAAANGVHAALADIPGLTTPSIGVTGAEDSVAAVHGVGAALDALNGQSATPSVGVEDNASGTLSNILGLLRAVDGYQATSSVTNVTNNITIDEHKTGLSRLGGVVGYALGGTVVPVQLAEAGTELLHFRGGGSALVSQRGVYGVPAGTYVTTADATAARGRGVTINQYFTGNVSATNLDDLMASAARAARAHFAGLGA